LDLVVRLAVDSSRCGSAGAGLKKKPWSVRGMDAKGVPPSVMEAIIHAGIMAPSGDNCQPWRFFCKRDTVDLHLVPKRSRSFFDVQHLGSLISIGAVVENMRIRAAGLGWRTEASLLPEGAASTLIARLIFQPCEKAVSRLDGVIDQRCVNRKPQWRVPPAEGLIEDWTRVVAEAGGRLQWLTDRGDIKACARLCERADWIRYTNRQAHESFMAELRFSREEAKRTCDGLPIPTLEAGPLAGPVLQFLRPWVRTRRLNHVKLYRALSLQTRMLVVRSGAIGLLDMPTWQDAAFLGGGQVLERLWLSINAADVAFQPVTVVTLFLLRLLRHGGEGFTPQQRRWVQDLVQPFEALFGPVGQRGLIMLFRVGYASAPTARTFRRKLEDFIASDDGRVDAGD
jgi:hypothetical protein